MGKKNKKAKEAQIEASEKPQTTNSPKSGRYRFLYVRQRKELELKRKKNFQRFFLIPYDLIINNLKFS